jgi:hypothetical protein
LHGIIILFLEEKCLFTPALKASARKSVEFTCLRLNKTDIKKCKINNWKERSKNRADWERAIKEAKVRIGL